MVLPQPGGSGRVESKDGMSGEECVMRAFAAAVAGVVLATAVAQTAGAGEGLDWRSRRDPFEIYVAATPPGPDEGQRTKKRRVKKPPTPPLRNLDPTRVLAEARGLLEEVGGMLEEKEYIEARNRTHVQLSDMKRAGLESRHEYEQVARYHETALRLHHRAAVETYLAKKNIRLQGLVWDEANPIVLIGGKMLREGDMIEDVTIESIGRNEVILVKDGVRIRKSM
jgi:hypothetical protein